MSNFSGPNPFMPPPGFESSSGGSSSGLLDVLLPLADYGTWGIVASAVTLALTMVWVVGLNRKVRQGVGRVSGFGTLPLVLWLGWMVIGLLAALGQDTLYSFWSSFPGIGFFPKVVALLARFTWLVVLISIGLSLIRHAGGLMERFLRFCKGVLIGPLQGKLSAPHVLMGGLFTSALLTNRELNEALFYAPSVATCMLGLYTLIAVRPDWKEIRRELSKKHIIEHGTLPYDRPVETDEDAELLREAWAELEADLAGDTLRQKIEGRVRVKLNIEKQLEAFEETQDQSDMSEEEARERLAEMEAEMEARKAVRKHTN